MSQLSHRIRSVALLAAFLLTAFTTHATHAAPLSAGAAKIDISSETVPFNNDTLHARALVLREGETTVVIVSVDVVAIGEIGPIGNEYLGQVRSALQKDLGIEPRNVMINASHCHGLVCKDVAARTVKVVKEAMRKVEPVTVGVGTGQEDRIMANRRLRLANGREADVRHAYSLPADAEVVGVGPIDPEIGILRLDRKNGETLAVVYQFACHPIQGVPNGGNTADITGFSSKVIEENMSEGTIALFLQGCGGDINPARYKDVDSPRDAEPLGNMLGLSTLRGLRKIKTNANGSLKWINETIKLPRADYTDRLDQLDVEQDRLLRSLRGTSLNLKTYLPLAVKYNLSREFPSFYSHRYMHEKMVGRENLRHLDAENQRNMAAYTRNIITMEKLTRLQTNIRLLTKNQAKNVASGERTIDTEVVGLRVGNFVLITFPGELTVDIGLGIKKRSPHAHTFVSGYTNGYIYYTPTAEQLKNVGGAQEDSDCLVAPEWQAIFEKKVAEVLKRL
jgi:hypothetical protein